MTRTGSCRCCARRAWRPTTEPAAADAAAAAARRVWRWQARRRVRPAASSRSSRELRELYLLGRQAAGVAAGWSLQQAGPFTLAMCDRWPREGGCSSHVPTARVTREGSGARLGAGRHRSPHSSGAVQGRAGAGTRANLPSCWRGVGGSRWDSSRWAAASWWAREAPATRRTPSDWVDRLGPQLPPSSSVAMHGCGQHPWPASSQQTRVPALGRPADRRWGRPQRRPYPG